MVSLLTVSVSLTSVSLLLVRWSLKRQIRLSLDADLQHSLTTFRNLSVQKNEMLSREAGLIADQPSLKALIATGDVRTVRDGSGEFAELSQSDFFALTSADGVLYTYANRGRTLDGRSINAGIRDCLERMPRTCFLFADNRLYVLASESIYFGLKSRRSQIGNVVIGYAVDSQVAQEVSEAAAAGIVFLVGGRPAASTLDPPQLAELVGGNRSDQVQEASHPLRLGRENYIAAAAHLGGAGGANVEVLALKSYDQASVYLDRLNLWMKVLGALALLLGSALAAFTARTVTKPLELLVEGTRALGRGDFTFHLGRGGATEVQELGAAFEQMRQELNTKQTELMESERLATIGRMASSVSHDLRHHLSAIYANAEFMSLPATCEGERVALLVEVHDAVVDMTDLIESLLLFGRTGQTLRRSFESTSALVGRAAQMVRRHPEARDVDLVLDLADAGVAWIDSRSLSRAVFNLLLNACQAAKQGQHRPQVRVAVHDLENAVLIRVEDNGPGVPESIRSTLFQPFVSAAKENGVGLGLTLAQHIAAEHGGDVRMEQSPDGLTRFDLLLYRSAWNKVVNRSAPWNGQSFDPEVNTAIEPELP